ncbi:hypothetical protein [Paenibacillus cremeus]|nr:hypothetical protein [Paenibacillus cremeus]
MHSITYYIKQHWHSGVLILGAVLALLIVYKAWDRIMVKSSGRK